MRLRTKEIQAITSGSTEFTEFYHRLKGIKDYHRRIPNQLARPFHPDSLLIDSELEDTQLETLFTGDEGFGRYLDLNILFQDYLNLKFVKRLNYLQYLGEFDKFNAIQKESKLLPEYSAYLEAMKMYLESFFKRAKPLFDLEKLKRDQLALFEEQWTQQTETIKSTSDLYCLACDKLFAKDTVFQAHKTGKKHIKASAALVNTYSNVNEALEAKERESADRFKAITRLEALIHCYCQQLTVEREQTKSHVERKQTLTEKERLEEVDEEVVEIVEEQEDDGEEETIYNPLKLPMGWDGKPIPYWLYKLHGLGVEYPCEICGNFVYMGRKAFDRHFQEWRHSHGMRCLGIPNSKQFHDVTSIKDAYALHEKLKALAKSESVSADVTEEFEDEQGNVYNKKTYEGIIYYLESKFNINFVCFFKISRDKEYYKPIGRECYGFSHVQDSF